MILSRGRLIILDIGLGNEANAQAALDSLIADFSDNPLIARVVWDTAQVYRELKKYEKANELYQHVIDNWPKAEHAILSRGGVIMADIGLGNDANTQAAIDNLIADFNDHPGLREVLYLVADKYHGRQKHKQAIELYQYVVDTWPKSDSALPAQMDVVISNLELGKYSEAQAATDKLIADFAVHPDLPDVLYGVAYEYQGRQRQEQAIELYQYIVDTWPESDMAVQAQMDVVISNIALGDDPNAQAAIDTLIADFNDDARLPEALHSIARTCERLSKYEEANNIYQIIVTDYAGTAFALKAQLDIPKLNILSLIESGNDPAAEAALDSLIADFNDHPTLPEAVFVIGEQYYNEAFRCENEGLDTEAKENFRKAIAVWERIITELPKSDPTIAAHAHYFSAICYGRLGQHTKAIECYQRVVDYWPDYEYAWSARFQIGSSYKKLRDAGAVPRSEANAAIKAAYQRVLEKYPDCPAANATRDWLNHHPK